MSFYADEKDLEQCIKRGPRIGDTIQTVNPMNCDTPMIRAGQYLHVQLDTAESVAEAIELIATGRWKIVEKKSEVAT